MNFQELKWVRVGEELWRGDGAIGIVLKREGERIEIAWVDNQGQRSFQTLESFKLLSMACGLRTPMVTIPPGRY
jgi:hypothetical protein